jgi:hypothetical protein
MSYDLDWYRQNTSIGWEVITPQDAAQLLERNQHNRELRPRRVDDLEREVVEGRFLPNGESIVVADNGDLLNGQHRLSAVVRAEKPIICVVVRGVPADTFKTFDQVIPRTGGDVFQISGEASPRTLARAVSHLWRHVTGRGHRSTVHPSAGEREELLADYPDLRESVKFIDETPAFAGLSLGLRAFLHCLFSRVAGNGDEADRFFVALSSGADLTPDSPILQLREILLANRHASRKRSREETIALTIKAWNLVRRGETVKMLMWRGRGAKPEPFPVPI